MVFDRQKWVWVGKPSLVWNWPIAKDWGALGYVRS
jgi:hypothetical protein